MTLEIGYSKENGDKKPTGDHPYFCLLYTSDAADD